MRHSLFDLYEISTLQSPPHVLEHDLHLVGVRQGHMEDTESDIQLFTTVEPFNSTFVIRVFKSLLSLITLTKSEWVNLRSQYSPLVHFLRVYCLGNLCCTPESINNTTYSHLHFCSAVKKCFGIYLFFKGVQLSFFDNMRMHGIAISQISCSFSTTHYQNYYYSFTFVSSELYAHLGYSFFSVQGW